MLFSNFSSTYLSEQKTLQLIFASNPIFPQIQMNGHYHRKVAIYQRNRLQLATEQNRHLKSNHGFHQYLLLSEKACGIKAQLNVSRASKYTVFFENDESRKNKGKKAPANSFRIFPLSKYLALIFISNKFIPPVL